MIEKCKSIPFMDEHIISLKLFEKKIVKYNLLLIFWILSGSSWEACDFVVVNVYLSILFMETIYLV